MIFFFIESSLWRYSVVNLSGRIYVCPTTQKESFGLWATPSVLSHVTR